ncbi:MAG: murein biosynthesis integral membrane protein MurJ, partial [Firmicutes bacterium]|nr:murein biosynthesis integral membrane protein MurJ [Bacillota bacterium]
MSTGRTIAGATLVIAFFSLLSRVLGLVRESVIAHRFGASSATDAYNVSFAVPSMLFFIISGALATVVVPVFTEYAERGERREAWRVFSGVFNFTAVIFLVLSLAGMALAPFLVRLTAPRFDAATAALAVDLTRIMFPLLLFAGLAALFTGLLNANSIFGVPAFSNSVNNAVIIASAVTLGSLYGIHGLAAGTVLAMACMAAVQLPPLLRAGFRFRAGFPAAHPGVLKVYHLALPVALGLSLNQLPVLINSVLASGLAPGSISSLNYANRLIQFPLALFVMALGTAVFPTLSGQAARDDREALTGTMARIIKITALGIVPAAAGLAALAAPIVALLYQRGAFDARATEMTAAALLFYSVGLVGQAGVQVLSRGFYALQDTRTPVKFTAVSVLLNLAASLVLVRFLQHGGLALAASLANLANMALLLHFLGRRLPGLLDAGMGRFTVLVLAASALMAAAACGVSGALEEAAASLGALGRLLQVGCAVTTGVLLYTGVMWKVARRQLAGWS